MVTPATARLARNMPVKAAPDLSRLLRSPMPGLVVAVTAAAGQAVKAGEELMVLEAMKMENALRAEQDCVVAAVLVRRGDTVEVEQPLMEFA